MLASLDTLKLWVRGRIWYFYIPLVVWYLYIFIRFIGNPNHEVLIMSLDLFFHEIGHVLFAFAGKFIGVLGGTIGQLVFPVSFLIYFIIKKEYFSVTFPLAWLGINFFNIARYMEDATCKCMDFYISSSGSISTTPEFHDWEYLFTTLHLLPFNIIIANMVRGIGFIVLIATISWSMYLLWIIKKHAKPAEMEDFKSAYPSIVPKT